MVIVSASAELGVVAKIADGASLAVAGVLAFAVVAEDADSVVEYVVVAEDSAAAAAAVDVAAVVSFAVVSALGAVALPWPCS